MSFEWVNFTDVVDCFDSIRVPLSSKERLNLDKKYPYYGAQGIIDHVDEYLFDGEYILLAEDGDNLRSKKLPISQIASGKFWVNNHAHIYKAKDCTSNLFVSAALNYVDINPFITGAAQPKLSQNSLKFLKIPFPDIKTQNAICLILGSIERKQVVLKELAEEYERLIEFFYREWFINFKFPNHEQVEFFDGIPEGWELKAVSELTQLISRGITPKYNDESGKSIVINQKCIRDNKLNLELARRQDKEIPDSKLVQKGDVLINSTGAGTLGRVTQVHQALADTTVDTHVTIVRPLQEISSAWFGAAISNLESYIETLGEGATNQLELKREVIGRIDLVCPAIDIQNQFQKIVEPMQQQILNLMKQNTHLRKLKETLLPRLMSGELDVSKLSSIE